MLKAFLGCYSVSNGEGAGRTSKWTWLIPLGDGARYNETSEGVWSTQLTYGGDPIILQVEQGELDENFNGEPTWVENTDFGGDYLAFGKFVSNNKGEIEPGEVWLDLTYDYSKYAVLGTINDGESDPPEGLEILGTAIKIAKCDKYKVRDGVQKLDELTTPVFNFTLGDLLDGTPKLDTYTPVDSQTRFESMNYTTRGKDEQGKYAGGVTCRCLQIKDFDVAEATDPDVSADLYLVRRYSNDTSSANLVYVPMSAYETNPDSMVPDAQTSSLQWRSLSSHSDSSESSTTSVDTKVLEAWHFSEISDVHYDLCVTLSGMNQHVMLRNATSGVIEYIHLSCLSVITDSQGMSDQKSIDWLSSDTMVPLELQLYGMDQEGEDKLTVQISSAAGTVPLLSGEQQFVIRSAAGGEIKYTNIDLEYNLSDALSNMLSGEKVVPDSSTEDSSTSSLQWLELSTEQGEVSGKVLQIFGFEKMDEVYEDISSALSGEQHVILRNAETSAVEYIQLSALSTQVSVDSEYGGQQNEMKSIQFGTFDDDDTRYIQLYGFTEELAQADHVSVQLSTNAKPLLGEEYEFVVRKTAQNGDRTIEYKSLSAACLSGGTGGGPGQLPGPFEMSLSANGNAAFTNCVLRIARAYFFFQDQTLQVPQTDQIIYVRAEHTDPPTISVGCGDYATVSYNLGNSWSNCLSTTITPLYRTLSGDVKCDYRYMMNIQAYDARNYSNSI